MIYRCLRNFKCNNVKGYPGKILSKEEVKDIKEFMSELQKNELLRIEEEKAAPKKKEKAVPKKKGKSEEVKGE